MKRNKMLLVALLALLLAGVVAALTLFLRREQPEPMPDMQAVAAPAGAQLLLFPMDDGVVSAGYRNAAYLEKHGYPHYGVDITTPGRGEADIVASGDGTVLGTEWCDNNLGHIVVVRYDDVYIPGTGEVLPLIARYYHMTAIHVATGGLVRAGTVIGSIDRGHEWHNHIHMELDADVDYPFHTPQVAEASSELLHRYPANGDGILAPVQLLVVGGEQRIVVRANAALSTEADTPLYTVSGE